MKISKSRVKTGAVTGSVLLMIALVLWMMGYSGAAKVVLLVEVVFGIQDLFYLINIHFLKKDLHQEQSTDIRKDI